MAAETVYLGHDNTIDLILKAGGVAVDLTSVDTITLTINGATIASENGATDPIRWIQLGYATGKIRISLGEQAISPGRYPAVLVVYDPSNPNGVVWGEIDVRVNEEVEMPEVVTP